MKGYIAENYLTTEEAAEKLGYSYEHFLRLLQDGKVVGAERWDGYAIPKDVTTFDVKVGGPGRPKKASQNP